MRWGGPEASQGGSKLTRPRARSDERMERETHVDDVGHVEKVGWDWFEVWKWV